MTVRCAEALRALRHCSPKWAYRGETVMFTFENKNALIIGAGRNIGRVIALEFASRGARVAVADIDKSGAEETAQLVSAAGGQAIGIGCDVMSEASVRDALGGAER